MINIPTLADIERGEDGFTGHFIVVNEGRVDNVLQYIEDVVLGYCTYMCIQHLECVTVNYNHDEKLCELTDENFGVGADVNAAGWWNYGTPPKSKEINIFRRM